MVTEKSTSRKQLVVSFVYLLLFPVLLFLLAGDWHWLEGWLFSLIFCGLSLFAVVYLYLKDPDLLNERFGPPIQKNQKSWDKFLLIIFFLSFLAWYVVMPLDARRFNWSPIFPPWLRLVGVVVFIIAFYFLFSAMRENTFAAPVVKMQRERGQKVISTGPYAIVRHPMYTGGLLLFIGGPLLLGSVLGLLVGALLIVILVVRIFGEEKMLHQELAGYTEYTQQVRARLIPYLF
ncbi:MAG TPA: isoprenylcysteine carboxylmethyltransferase family protein [Pyrinomonadaceae bacterium]|nr:isoprenylcysteine carboxylmethyltransferase family protein [Pyrinomonadaceae bacterium]